MVWTVRLEKPAAKQLKKLGYEPQRLIQDYINQKLKGCDDPRDFGKALRHDKAGLWRYRVDKYRIVCELRDTVLVILIVQIGKRDRVYDD